MEYTTKFLGGFVLLVLFAGHLLLLGFFFAPTDKLMALILPEGTSQIEATDIPVPVGDFLLTNKIVVEGAMTPTNRFLSNLTMGLLEFRRNHFMNDSEKLALNLNLLPFGEDIIGIEAASHYYYKKPISEISDTQVITLINLQKIFAE